MSETAANRVTSLCLALAAFGALTGLLVNSGTPAAVPGPAPAVQAGMYSAH